MRVCVAVLIVVVLLAGAVSCAKKIDIGISSIVPVSRAEVKSGKDKNDDLEGEIR